MVLKKTTAGVKRTASSNLTAMHEDEAERKRFNEVVEKRIKLDDAMSRRAARIAKEQEISKSRGVIYIGHIPHGFYEDELRKYFSQFGEVTRVRVSRSRKTGGSRGYAFVEFLHDAVAKVAAETMNGYLMFERLLKCHVVPKEKVHPDMFSPRFPFPLNREITRTFINMERTETRVDRNKELRLARLQKQMDSLKELGITYDVTAIDSVGSKVIKSDKPIESKVKQPKIQTNSSAAGVKKKKTTKKSASSIESEPHVLLVDSDDDEIEFKTPPHSVRKLKSHSKTVPVSRSLEKNVNRLSKKRMSATPRRLKQS